MAYTILFDNNWDPHTLLTLSQHLVPAMDLLDASCSFTEGAELIVDISIDLQGTGNVYIDDLIQAADVINGTDNSIKCKCATLLTINTCTSLKYTIKPIPSKDMDAWPEQTQSQGRFGGAKKCPGVATGHKTYPRTITRKQVCCLDQLDHRGHTMRNNIGQRSREHQRVPWSSQNGTICPQLLKQTTQPPN